MRKKLASYHSLWRHKKNRIYKSAAVEDTSAAGTPTIKFLSEKVEDVRARLDHLMKKIATESDILACERNEAVLSLDNLRRRDAISPDMYKHYNTLLSSSLPTPTVKKGCR